MSKHSEESLYEVDEREADYTDLLEEVRDLKRDLRAERRDERREMEDRYDDAGRRKKKKRLDKIENKLAKIETKLKRLERRQAQAPKPKWWQKGLIQLAPSVLRFLEVFMQRSPKHNQSRYQLPLQNNPPPIDLVYDKKTKTFR